MDKLEIENVQLVNNLFDKVLEPTLLEMGRVDFAFVDGNHQKQSTLNYYETIAPRMSEKGVMVFDDIHWSKGMEEAWCAIIDREEVTLSLDLFGFGVVFFDSGFTKQNFILSPAFNKHIRAQPRGFITFTFLK